MEIMIAGDWHGDTTWACKMVRMAKRHGIERIYQCGDFGLWDHKEDGVRYLDTLNAECRENGVKVYFLDGNHENHDRLEWYDRHNPRDYGGVNVYIRSHILHIPRGTRWEADGRILMAVGGAYSVDKMWRKPGESWWAGETLHDGQLKAIEQRYGNTPPVDILLTHDCPTNAPFKYRLKNDPDSQIHRQKMDKVGKILRPRLWFHGHMHERYDYGFQHSAGLAQVTGLEMNGDFWSWVVLDLETLNFRWGAQIK